MLRLAVRNLVQNKARLFISIGGVGLALSLVLLFQAILTGATGRLTVYIDRAGADLWVSQQGVQTMHMSASVLPELVTDQVRAVPGVQQVMPLMYAQDMLQAKGSEFPAYVFGLPTDAPFGSPWKIVAGVATPGPGQVIIDHAIAAGAGLRVGNRITVLGQEMTIAGLTAGTSSISSSDAFIRMADFTQVVGQGQVISFVLVKVASGASRATVATRIGQSVSGVTVQTRQQFASSEGKLVSDMTGDILTIVNTAGVVTGLAVLALTVYIGTIARRREYGVLKAIGMGNGALYHVVLVQALLCVALGLLTGLGITLLLSLLMPRVSETLVLSISTASIVRVALVSVLIAGVAALLPAGQIGHLEPVSAIRRG
jgi:putative ABC transport system permease protein